MDIKPFFIDQNIRKSNKSKWYLRCTIIIENITRRCKMKRIIFLAVVLFVAVNFNAEAKKHYNGVGGYFYSQLSPYGSWIEVDYGVIVWRPTIIRANWQPYQMGRWIWTYDGWYWDSYEPFGFVTYHYGRWYYDDYYGWLWYPDYEWAPAWVEWRYDNNYIGWAPLHPYAVFSVSVGIYYSNVYYTPYYHWNYVTYVNFCDPYVSNYYVGSGPKYRVHKGTKSRNNFVYYNGRVQNKGVDVKYVSVRSGKEIKQRDLLRVSDSRELSRDGYRDQDKIRTLEMSRDQLMKNDLGRMEIKREKRKTSVDMEKVKIGKRENVTTEVRKDNSRERKLDGLKTDQNRNNIKNTVDKVFEKNRSNDKSKVDQNVQKETKNSRITQNNREIVSRNENQIKQQNGDQTNKSQNLDRKKQEQPVKVKNANTRKSPEQINQTNVRQESGANNQQKNSTDKKQNSSRTKEQDKSRERKR